ncbi:uncharacterized protein LOC141673184 [Apium graveolens]|uniref:uncharacterized protein LOC141673184 n=1 Tax=Apium graveolens TaxID=4045 RepID=UPI003D7B82EC
MHNQEDAEVLGSIEAVRGNLKKKIVVMDMKRKRSDSKENVEINKGDKFLDNIILVDGPKNGLEAGLGFFGYPDRGRRRESRLKELARKFVLPWCIIGDFNDMMYEDEKRGGRKPPYSLLTGFQETLNEWKRFKFENTWIREQESRNISKNGWEVSGGDDIMEKIRICGLRLQEWGGGIRAKFKLQLQECRRLLKQLRLRRDRNGVWRYNEVREEYLKLLERQDIYWKQRAKQHWLREGDKNTRFIHKFASTRRRNNKIDRIKNIEGNWQESVEGVQSVIEGYFTELFKSSNTDGQLSIERK